MSYPRIIPCLLLDQDGLVKTTQFANKRYIGDPINAVRIYNEKEVDELTLFDITATVNGQGPRLSLIEKIASECRMPLTYGGGITDFDTAEKIISMGVEKISIGFSALETPNLIKEIATSFGNQSTAVCIDYKRNWMGKRTVFTHNGTKKVDRDIVELVAEAVNYGAGEIILYSISDDGMMKGFDLSFAKSISSKFEIPMTFVGGAGQPNDIQTLFSECGNVGAGVGSMFVYKGALKGVLINYPNPAEKNRILSLS